MSTQLEGRNWITCCSKGCEQEQYQRIPYSSLLHYEGAIVHTRRPNHWHDEVKSVTAIKHFCRKRVAVNPLLHTFVLRVSKHQQIMQSELPLAFGWFLQLQCLKKGVNLNFVLNIICIRRVIGRWANRTQINVSQVFSLFGYTCPGKSNSAQAMTALLTTSLGQNIVDH